MKEKHYLGILLNGWKVKNKAQNEEKFHTLSLKTVGARGFEPPTSSTRTMRASGLRYAPTGNAR